MMDMPPPPPGYEIQSAGDAPPPPPGYELQDSNKRRSPAALKQDNSAAGRAARRAAEQDEMVANMSTFEKLSAGAGKAVVDTGRGIGQLIGKISKEDVARARQTDEALMKTGAGKVGNVLGYVGEAVPLGIAAGAAGLGTGAAAALGTKMAVGGATGAAQGYAAPYASTGEHVANTLVGGGLGAIIPGAGAAAGKVVRGLATPEARALAAEGVKLTPGQMLGGMAKTFEDKLTSVPIVGGAIRNAQNRAVESFSNAAANRVLEPLGMSLPKGVKAGREALNYAQQAVTHTYNQTLNKMSANVDNTFRGEIGQLWNTYGNKLGTKADELHQFITDGVLSKLAPSGPTAGRVVHEIQSDLGQQASRLMKSELQSDRTLGKAVKELQGSVKDMLKRNNPTALNEAYASATDAFKNLVRIQKAASALGAPEGVITPNVLRSAVRATDSTRNKLSFSQGRAPMQDLAEAGVSTIPSKIADSGTAGRLNATELLANTALLPATLTGGAVAHGVYSPAGQKIMQAAFMPRQNPVTNYLANLAQNRLGAPANALAAQSVLPNSMVPPAQVPQQ